jgi:hypothetical protein
MPTIIDQLNFFRPAILPYNEHKRLNPSWRHYGDRIDTRALGMRFATVFALAIGSYFIGTRSVRALTDRTIALMSATGTLLYLLFEAYRTDRAVKLDIQNEFENGRFYHVDDRMEDPRSIKILLMLEIEGIAQNFFRYILMFRWDSPISKERIQSFRHIVDHLAKSNQKITTEDLIQMIRLDNGGSFVKYALEKEIIPATQPNPTPSEIAHFWDNLNCELDTDSARQLVQLGYKVDQSDELKNTLLDKALERLCANKPFERASLQKRCLSLLRAGATCNLQAEPFLRSRVTVEQWLEQNDRELLSLIRQSNQ